MTDPLETEARSGSAPIGGDQDLSEHLDDDKLGGDFPPDEPLGVEEYGITNHEQRYPEPIAERVEREIPDDLASAADVTRHGTVLDRSGDVPAEEAAVHVVDDD
jgi:hypothetical protein